MVMNCMALGIINMCGRAVQRLMRYILLCINRRGVDLWKKREIGKND